MSRGVKLKAVNILRLLLSIIIYGNYIIPNKSNDNKNIYILSKIILVDLDHISTQVYLENNFLEFKSDYYVFYMQ